MPKSRKSARSQEGEDHDHHASHRHHASTTTTTRTISVDPTIVQRALNEVVKTLNSPEYRTQVTKMTQASIVNSLQTFQRLSTLSERLVRMDNKTIESIVRDSVTDLTKAVLQYNSDQLVLLQKLSARTLEILDSQTVK